MDTESQIILATSSYKIISLLLGTSISYMGYRLFLAGIWGEAGDVEAQFKDNKIVIKRAAPGTFFALFGAIVICLTIYEGLSLHDYGNQSTENMIKIVKDKSNELPENLPF